jgi:hypothetical protein
MARDGTTDASASASTATPDEAFAVLGDETRLRILTELGEADGGLSFSALYDRVDVSDTGQFNYHLQRLVGRFVEKTGDGYALRRAGRRIVEAILAGAVSDAPTVERTRVDESCEYCGAPVEVTWRAGSVETYCTDCRGKYGRSYCDDGGGRPAPSGYLGRLPLPPAGVRDRTPTEMLRAAWTWGNLEILAAASGICPRCSAPVDHEVRVCEDHDDEGLCDACESRYAARVVVECTNCIFEVGGALVLGILDDTALLAFLTEHGLDPISPASVRRVNRVHEDYAEEIRSTEPFEARLTFEADGDELTLTIDGSLRVVDVERR